MHPYPLLNKKQINKFVFCKSKETEREPFFLSFYSLYHTSPQISPTNPPPPRVLGNLDLCLVVLEDGDGEDAEDLLEDGTEGVRGLQNHNKHGGDTRDHLRGHFGVIRLKNINIRLVKNYNYYTR